MYWEHLNKSIVELEGLWDVDPSWEFFFYGGVGPSSPLEVVNGARGSWAAANTGDLREYSDQNLWWFRRPVMAPTGPTLDKPPMFS